MKVDGATIWGEAVPIDFVHNFLSCISLPLYFRNIFTDQDHPGIGVLTNAGVSPLAALVNIKTPLPNRPTPTRTTYLGSGLLVTPAL